MIDVHLEPKGLDREAKPLADFAKSADDKHRACIGSEKLLGALLKLAPPPERRREPRRQSWPVRQHARDQILCIRRIVSEYFGRSISDMLSKRGAGSLCLQRQIAMYLSRELAAASYADIGAHFGDRDHTTVLHSCRQVEKLLLHDIRVMTDVAFLIEAIGGEE